jgi:hypothetical protein
MLVWTLQSAQLVVASVTYKVETRINLRQPCCIIEGELFVLLQPLRPNVLYSPVVLTNRLIVPCAGMSNSYRSDASGLISHHAIGYSRLAFFLAQM